MRWNCEPTRRATKDIDVTLHDDTRLSREPEQRREQVRAMLQEAAAIRLDDYFEFLVGEAREELDGAPEGGSRHPVEARMDGREFALFHVDIGIGDEVLEPLDIVTGEDWLRFAGVKRHRSRRFRRNSSLRKNCTPTRSQGESA